MLKSEARKPRSTVSATSVKFHLRAQIEAGAYQAGAALPAERVLAATFGANRRTVRSAVEQLAAEGLLSIKPNCRPVVTHPVTQMPSPRAMPVNQHPNSKFVALVMWHGTPDQMSSPNKMIFWGMNAALGKSGYHGVFLDLGDTIDTDDENAKREAARLEYALDQGFGGAIFYPYSYRQNIELVRHVARLMPLVLIDRMLPGIDTDYVGIDNRGAAKAAVDYLLGLGHTRLAHVTWNDPFNPVGERVEGFTHGIRSAFGVNAEECILMTSVRDKERWPLFETLMKMPRGERPTAITCINDYEALRIGRRLTDLGLNIPDDVSLIGFDDVLHTLPSGIGLTTVAQPYEAMGAAAAEALLRRMENPGSLSTHTELPARLIVRESCRSLI